MVSEYLKSNSDFVSAEIRGVKVNRAGRETYGDTAVGFVQLKREANICKVKAVICPEHEIHSKGYNVDAGIGEKKEKVLKLSCRDCVASLGGCKHAVAFLMWLHRRSEDPSPTEIECYWKKSILSKVGTSIKYMTAEEIGSKIPPLENVAPTFRDRFLQQCQTDKVHCLIANHLTPYFYNEICLHDLMCLYKRDNARKYKAQDFLLFCSNKMTDKLCEEAENNTREQSDEFLWHTLRQFRVTASKIWETSKCKTSEGVSKESILGAQMYDSVYMQRGRLLEKEVIKELETKYKTKINKVGLILSPSLPALGASPDGITENFVVEIKCPAKASTIKNYISLKGEIPNKFYSQIQMQMHFCKRKKGVFAVASANFESDRKVQSIIVTYDKKFCENIIKDAMQYWKTNIFTELIK